MSTRSPGARTLSRREFVAVVAAGSAAVLSRPADALADSASPAANARPKPAPAAGPKMTAAQQKEYDRQHKSTLETLKTIRDHAMPAGTEMASVFHARRAARKGR